MCRLVVQYVGINVSGELSAPIFKLLERKYVDGRFLRNLVLVCKDITRHTQVDSNLITDPPRILAFGKAVFTQDN